MGATCFKEHALPDSTANGITYPVPGDYVKAAEFASKLAKDFETLALTADQAIVAGVAQGIIPVLSGYVKPQPIPSGTDLLTLDTGWWYNRLTSVAGTMANRPQGVTDGPFMVHMVRTPFGHSTITYYGYSGTAGGLFENHTGNAAHTAWVGWRRLDGTTGGGITQGSGLAGFANILRTQLFRDAMGSVTTGGKGAIAFRFDHGLSKFNSIMRPLLEARGIKYSLALSARNFNAGENAGVTASMVNGWSGAEVWNHGANQHQDESSVPGLTDQIVTGLAELQAAIPDKQIWGYAVPGTGGSGQGGFFGGATAEQFYETAAGDLILTNHAVSSGSMSGTSRRPLDGRIRQGMAHFTIEAQTVARIKSEIDNAISNKTGNQLMMHPNLLNTEGYLTTAQLVEVLDYVVAKRDAGELVVLSPYEMVVAQLSTSGGGSVPGPPGAGVPAGGEALQVIRKNAFNTTTEWATLTKSLVGLSNVDNTSDMNKPVSTMQKLALDEKADKADLEGKVDVADVLVQAGDSSFTDGSIVKIGSYSFILRPDVNMAVVLGGGVNNENVIGGNFDNVNTATSNLVGVPTLTGTDGQWNFILSGYDNVVNGWAVIMNGFHNRVATGANHATISGGSIHTIEANVNYSTIGGGTGNVIKTGGSAGTISGGINGELTGSSATLGGGTGNKSNGFHSTVAGGGSNQVTGNMSATISGGENGVASGAGSVIPGGNDNTASGYHSTAAGRGAVAGSNGMRSYGAKFATNGDAQDSTVIMKRESLDAAAGGLSCDGASGLVIPENTTWAIEGLVVARRADVDGENAAWKFTAVLKRDAGNTAALVGTPVVTSVGSNAGNTWAVAIGYATAGNLNVTATGEAGKTIRWLATLRIAHVSG